jgi:hypothetical protein
MFIQDSVPPPFSYALAVAAGLSGLPFMYYLVVSVAGLPGVDYGDWVPGTALGFAICHSALGVLFGLLWPGGRWRWGVWLTATPLCFVSFLAPDPWVFLLWAAASLPTACAASSLTARLRLKYF